MENDLNQFLVDTPLLGSYDKNFTSLIYLKLENLQRCGSYKIRGIISVIQSFDEATLRKGISVASAGNMALAVAFAANHLAFPCEIYVPDTAPAIKLAGIKECGAEIVQLPYTEVWNLVRGDFLPNSEKTFIHPALNNNLILGYGNIAKEIITMVPDLDAMVIPFGVGGLTIGMSKVLKSYNPAIAIYTSEPETAAPLHLSLQLKKATSITRFPSFVDAIGTPEVLPAVFEQVQYMVTESLVMTIEEIKQALSLLLNKHKLVCEGAAACSYAAALRLQRLGRHRKIGCILSGGNINLSDLNLLNTSFTDKNVFT